LIEHAGRSYNDMQDRPYEFSRRAVNNWRFNECEVVIVYGMPEGVGKSVYISHTMADVKGWLNTNKVNEAGTVDYTWMFKKACERPKDVQIWNTDYMGNKELILYKPKDVVNFLKEKMSFALNNPDLDHKETAIPMWHWDDGGTWLNGMEFNDLFVKAFMKFLPLARSACGLVVISTPVEEWVLKKLHTASGVIHCPVIKCGSDEKNFWRPRLCKSYQKVKTAYHTRSFPRYAWEDYFTAFEPDDYHAWYKPRRDGYAALAVAQMDKALEKKHGSGQDVSDDELVLSMVKGSIDKKEQKDKILDADSEAKDLMEIISQSETLATVPEKIEEENWLKD
jgi:hypothetical protein